MKNIKYIIFTILFLFVNVLFVNASCTDEKISSLKEMTSDIKITYRYLGKIEEEEGVFDNQYEVKIKNMNDDLYISLFNGTTILKPVDGEIVSTFNNGTWNFDIYSNKCDTLIDSIEVFIPRFNEYSLDPLCEGIDGDDFPLCGKYYEYDVSYESFKERVNYYRTNHNIDNNLDDENDDQQSIELILDDLFNYIIEYRLYIVISLVVLLIIIILIIVFRRRRKRGVLE